MLFMIQYICILMKNDGYPTPESFFLLEFGFDKINKPALRFVTRKIENIKKN